jgi:hypothetical protein
MKSRRKKVGKGQKMREEERQDRKLEKSKNGGVIKSGVEKDRVQSLKKEEKKKRQIDDIYVHRHM